jgi:hypothetical protein
MLRNLTTEDGTLNAFYNSTFMYIQTCMTYLAFVFSGKISSTSGGRSVGMDRSRTKSHGVCLFFLVVKIV